MMQVNYSMYNTNVHCLQYNATLKQYQVKHIYASSTDHLLSNFSALRRYSPPPGFATLHNSKNRLDIAAQVQTLFAVVQRHKKKMLGEKRREFIVFPKTKV